MIIDVVFEQLGVQLFDAEFEQSNGLFDAEFEQNEILFEAELLNIQRVTEYVGGELYQGEYTVRPQFEEQEMQTKGKVMVKDVTINEIPVFRVGNTSGGITVYIANEV